MLNQTNIQDWPQEDRAALMAAILTTYAPENYDDICVVGGRVAGWSKPDSDIDCIIFIDDYEWDEESKILRKTEYAGMEVRVTRIASDKKLAGHQGYTMPVYSLESDTVMNVNAADINAWLDAKIAAIPGFMDERGLERLIVERI